MGESEALAALLDAIEATKISKEELSAAETELPNATEERAAEIRERMEELRISLDDCVDRENDLRKSILGILKTDSDGTTKRDKVNDMAKNMFLDAQDDSPVQSNMSFNFKIPTPAKYQRGQNFSKFCEKFIDYITLSKIQDDNLYILFLNLLDDFTLDKLRKVPLSLGQRKDARGFLEVYEKKMSPSHGGRTYRTKLTELKQDTGEKVEDFAYRIADTASRAYSDTEHMLQEEASFATFMKGLCDQDLRMKLHEDVSISTFDGAVDEATRLENLRDTLKVKRVASENDITQLEVFKMDRTDKSTTYPQYQKHRSNDTRRERNNFQQRTPGNPSENRPRRYNENSSQRGADSRQDRGKTVICYKCNMPNHIARNCTANLNY